MKLPDKKANVILVKLLLFWNVVIRSAHTIFFFISRDRARALISNLSGKSVDGMHVHMHYAAVYLYQSRSEMILYYLHLSYLFIYSYNYLSLARGWETVGLCTWKNLARCQIL